MSHKNEENALRQAKNGTQQKQSTIKKFMTYIKIIMKNDKSKVN